MKNVGHVLVLPCRRGTAPIAPGGGRRRAAAPMTFNLPTRTYLHLPPRRELT